MWIDLGNTGHSEGEYPHAVLIVGRDQDILQNNTDLWIVMPFLQF